MNTNNNKVMETAKDKFLKKVEDILKTYCLEAFMDEIEGDELGDIYADNLKGLFFVPSPDNFVPFLR